MKKIYMMKLFLTEYKFILTEEKGNIMRIYFIEYKFVLVE